jgi:hypothetical protein
LPLKSLQGLLVQRVVCSMSIFATSLADSLRKLSGQVRRSKAKKLGASRKMTNEKQ